MARERSSSPQTLLLLQQLIARPRAWRHGYELSAETGLQSGTIYPVLIRLAERGFLDCKWQPSEIAGRPPRRLYRLTSDGAAFARAQLRAADAAEKTAGARPLPLPAPGRS